MGFFRRKQVKPSMGLGLFIIASSVYIGVIKPAYDGVLSEQGISPMLFLVVIIGAIMAVVCYRNGEYI